MEQNWNLKLLYKSIKDPQIEKDIQRSKKEVSKFVKKWKNTDKYLTNPTTLFTALKEYEKLMEDPGICTKPSYYIFLNRAIDQENTELKSKENLLHKICLELENSIQFFLLELSKVPQEKQKGFLNSPVLNTYNHFLKTLFNSSKYILSDSEEKIFNIKSKTSHSNWVSMLSELLSKQTLEVQDENGNTKKISYNEVSKYLDSKEKKVRDIAGEKFLEINRRYEEIAEFEINSVLENKTISDTYRNIPTPQTTRLLSDNMDEDVVETLRNTVTQNFDISKRFYKLKAKILKQDKLAYYERNVSIGDIEKEYQFENSFDIVKNTFNRLDKEFVDILNTYISEGRYDVYPKKGKDGGAFCVGVGSKYPTYILLNHNDRLQDVLTIAHESGHGIHTEYSNKQNVLNQGYSTACAEVASTFFEDFTLEEIRKNLSKKDRNVLLLKSLEQDISSIFRQIACYNFELQLHKQFKKNGFLSTKEISNIFTHEMYKYLGDYVDRDEHMKLGWIYWSHIRTFFYTYSYASGLLISKYLQKKVRENTKNIEYIKTFFKAGDSKSPKDIFFDMGIDISKKDFWLEGIQSINENLSLLEKDEQF